MNNNFPQNHLKNQENFLIRENFLKEHVLPFVKDKTVLEIGCFDGYISTTIAEHDPKFLILLEGHKFSLQQASLRLGKTSHKAIHGDMHLDLDQVEKIDVALLLGIIYHSHAPLHILEQLIHHCDPDQIFIDNPGNSPGCIDENANTPGNRMTIGNYKSCGITCRIDDNTLVNAMNNLGYNLIWKKHYPTNSMSEHVPIFYFTKQ